ncbi:MAG: hypothetical protein HY303_12145 [Candidatus Wallbacteria bacterium]|nr:hypothetical protein [Candidatus Wallbacteria bacterium]
MKRVLSPKIGILVALLALVASPWSGASDALAAMSCGGCGGGGDKGAKNQNPPPKLADMNKPQQQPALGAAAPGVAPVVAAEQQAPMAAPVQLAQALPAGDGTAAPEAATALNQPAPGGTVLASAPAVQADPVWTTTPGSLHDQMMDLGRSSVPQPSSSVQVLSGGPELSEGLRRELADMGTTMEVAPTQPGTRRFMNPSKGPGDIPEFVTYRVRSDGRIESVFSNQ